MADRIGQQLGNYRLIRLLGQGGFADVYLGEHLFLATMVAIKVLHTRVTPRDMEQFQREARILTQLKHPHIIEILDFGFEERTPYLIMSYAPHGTLRTRYPKGTAVPITTVVEYVKQVAEALQYAHERNIVHRDIKPENVLISEKDEILLSDFGIALIEHSSLHQSTKDMAGTIGYMAPEQISAHPRAASDQYSLGIAAYEWLCGTRPFHGTYTEIAVKHSTTPPPPLRKYIPTLSPDVEYVILTALEKLPERRFGSISAFATALEQASQHKRSIAPGSQPRNMSDQLSSSAPPQIPLPQSGQLPIAPPPSTELPARQANQQPSSALPAISERLAPQTRQFSPAAPPPGFPGTMQALPSQQMYVPALPAVPGNPPSTPPYTPQVWYTYPPQPPPNDPADGYAITGMVLGIVSLVLLSSGIGIITAIVGIVFSLRGRRSVSRKSMASAGLVTSIITLALVLALVAIGLIVWLIVSLNHP